MTKLTTTLLLTAVVVSCTPVQAGLLDSLATSGWTDKSVTTKYKLPVYGYDARAYEWIPKDNQNVRCVFVASNKSSGVACYDVEEKRKK